MSTAELFEQSMGVVPGGVVTAAGMTFDWNESLHPRLKGKFVEKTLPDPPGQRGATDNAFNLLERSKYVDREYPDQRPVGLREASVWTQYVDTDGNRTINDGLRQGRFAHLPRLLTPAMDVSQLKEPGYMQVLPEQSPEDAEDDEPRLPYSRRIPDLQALDSRIASSVFRDDAVLYRGVSVPQNIVDRVEPGVVISDQGYTSLSASRSDAREFALLRATGESARFGWADVPFEGVPLVMEFHVPKSTPAMTGATAVEEMVLARGTSVQVLGTRPDGTLVVQVLSNV